MIHIVSTIAFGDSLITLSLIEQLGADVPQYRVLGSEVTIRVSALMRSPIPVTRMVDGESALYTVKANGPFRALSHFVQMRRVITEGARRGDVFAFEFPDIRSAALVPRGCTAVFAPKTESAYEDRRDLIRRVFGRAPSWRSCARPGQAIRKVLMNPCARHRDRYLPAEALDILVSLASDRGWLITLLDPCGQFHSYADRIHRYIPRPELPDAAAHLRNSDLYIGPDSFFLHLAYYLGIPCFGFFLQHHLPYLLPGMRELENFVFYGAAKPQELRRSLLAFVDG